MMKRQAHRSFPHSLKWMPLVLTCFIAACSEEEPPAASKESETEDESKKDTDQASDEANKEKTSEEASKDASEKKDGDSNDGAKSEHAEGGHEGEEEHTDTAEDASASNDGDLISSTNPIDKDTPEEVKEAKTRLIERLRERSRSLEFTELELAKKDAAIKNLQNELRSRMDSISALEQRLQEQLGIGRVAKERREERVSALAELLSTMPPQAGSDILAQMSDQDAQSLLLAVSVQSERKAAKILSLMPPNRAAQLGQLYLNIESPPPGSEDLGTPSNMVHATTPAGASLPPSANKTEATP